MVARIEIEDFENAQRQKTIADALGAMEGIKSVAFAKGAVHVGYDPLQTSEKKIEETITRGGSKIVAAAAEREIPHPDTSSSSGQKE